MKLKERLAGLTDKLGAPVTVNVTATVCGLLAAPVAVTLTEPVYVPTVNPAVLIETLTLPGVVPPPLADNQVPPELATVKVSADPLLLTANVWAAGAVLPVV